METNSKEYMVHYNGWSNKWNELVPESRLKIRSDNATFGESGVSQVKSTEPGALQGEIPIQVSKKPAKKIKTAQIVSIPSPIPSFSSQRETKGNSQSRVFAAMAAKLG